MASECTSWVWRLVIPLVLAPPGFVSEHRVPWQACTHSQRNDVPPPKPCPACLPQEEGPRRRQQEGCSHAKGARAPAQRPKQLGVLVRRRCCLQAVPPARPLRCYCPAVRTHPKPRCTACPLQVANNIAELIGEWQDRLAANPARSCDAAAGFGWRLLLAPIVPFLPTACCSIARWSSLQPAHPAVAAVPGPCTARSLQAIAPAAYAP